MTPPLSSEEKARRLQARKDRNPNFLGTRAAQLAGGRPKGEMNPRIVTPENRLRKGPICGYNRSGKSTAGSGICCMPAGWGTATPGEGPCRKHNGNAPGMIIKQTREKAIKKAIVYGAPREVTADVAIMEEIQRSAGHVAWLQAQIAAMDSPDELSSMTSQGIKPSAILQLYQQERANLVKVSAVAISTGIAEKHLHLLEQQATMMAKAFMAFVNSQQMKLTPEQRINARPIIRDIMMGMSTDVIDVEERELTAIPPTRQPPADWAPMEVFDDNV